MSDLAYFIYDQIPGAWPKWTVAVLAINQRDADEHVKIHWHGGHRIGKFNTPGGKVQADCGDVTTAAGEVLKRSR